jgi:hypothetical protein
MNCPSCGRGAFVESSDGRVYYCDETGCGYYVVRQMTIFDFIGEDGEDEKSL